MKLFTFFLLMFAIICTTNAQTGKYRNGIFLHHSTGGCIWGPNGGKTSVTKEITSYNSSNNLSGNDAFVLTERSWPETPWDNEWYRWHNIFQNEDKDADIKPILQANKIIIIKSCYPSSSMEAGGSVNDTNQPTKKTILNYKWHWRNIIGVMKSHPECFFVIWTNAPLVANATNTQQAVLSHKFCLWAKDTLPTEISPGYGEFPKNVFIFDFFHKLVGTDFKLKPEYAASSGDSHPNSAATELVAPQFIKEVCDAAIAYENATDVKNEQVRNNSCQIRYSSLETYLHIKVQEETTLRYDIYSLNGTSLYSINNLQILSGENNINIEAKLIPGIYFLNVQIGKERHGLVFVK